MVQEDNKEQKQLGRNLKEMRELAYQLDPIIDRAASSREKTEEILKRNKLALLASQIFVAKRSVF